MSRKSESVMYGPVWPEDERVDAENNTSGDKGRLTFTWIEEVRNR